MSKKLTTEDFILKARQVHGWKYDYSMVEYIDDRTKIYIKCNNCKRGFWQTPNSHLSGHGCPFHGGVKFNKEIFIKKAIEIHGGKYDYSKVNYINSSTKVCIICPIHGEFWQTPNLHLSGSGCKKCANEKIRCERKSSKQIFIEKAIEVHGCKYDYSKVEYKNARTKVEIICPLHGSFFQIPDNHIRGKNGCPICKNEKISNKSAKTKDEFIKDAISIHGNKYNYSLVEYKNAKTKVCIICNKHGAFWQKPDCHLRGCGCPICGDDVVSEKKSMSTDEFIKKSLLIYGDKYDYSLVKRARSNDKISIICKKHNYEFKTLKSNFLRGHGCPLCKSSRGELKIEEYLKNNNIKYESQYPVKLQKRMFSRNNLKIDFYLPIYNTFIEFNGEQHYEFTPIFHKSEDDFQKQVERDERLKDYCKKNKIKLIVIKYNQINKIEKILNKELTK